MSAICWPGEVRQLYWRLALAALGSWASWAQVPSGQANMAMRLKEVRLLAIAAVAAALLSAGRTALAQATPPIEFAPGVLTTIPAEPQDEEMFSGPRPLVEVPIAIEGLEYDPKLSPKTATVFERMKTATLRRTIWNLEFSFKPMRMIYV